MPQPTKAQTAREKLILALDVPSMDEAIAIVKELKDEVGLFKIGLELYAHSGTRLFEAMRAEGVPFFFDCKFHDIPNTVARASQGLVGQGIAMFNVHATGGFEMMQATAKATHKAAREANVAAPKIISVTMLTSISDKEASEIGFGASVSQLVPQLALLTKKAGLDGVVASAQEVQAIRQACGPDFFIVTPGIRPAWSASDDQKRIVTPGQAIKDGADYLVVGRPITQASSRRDAARRVVEEMESIN
ncbi:MAG: orotidine-5'-phosphate decarboxylase [Cyanobacteria bacterium SZAS-4]|nr:orotidine-5'-phosphate decarboxylase [Cyanobacteria bacterium SZAS-4]